MLFFAGNANMAALPHPTGLEVSILQGDPHLPEPLQAAGAAPLRQPRQSGVHVRLHPHPQLEAIPQGGMESVAALNNCQVRWPYSYFGTEGALPAEPGTKTGSFAPAERGQHLPVKALPVHVAPRLVQAGRRPLLRPEEEVVHMDERALVELRQVSPQSRLARGAGAVNGHSEGSTLSPLLVDGAQQGKQPGQVGCLLYTSPSPRDCS